MNGKLKVGLAAAGAALVINFGVVQPARAYVCPCVDDAVQILTRITGSFAPFLANLIQTFGNNTEQAVVEAGAATRAELTKAAVVNKTVEEGLEAYRQEQQLQTRTAELREAMQQPATTCKAIATSTGLQSAWQDSQVRAFSTQAKVMGDIARNTNTVQHMDEAHKKTNQAFCTPEEAQRGVCSVNQAERYAGLAGADHDAAFLFQGADGSPSYKGVDNSGQIEAANSYIKRVVGGIPPEQLRSRSQDYYKRSPQARAYVELQRRYNAMLSMGAYSLSQIEEMHRTKAGLGKDTLMADVSVGGFQPNKYDMSMSEVVERFVASKFSPDAVRDLARAVLPNLILRDMLQMNSFQLWMSYQAMLKSSRTEALTAHQLALMAEETLRPQMEQQRQAAARAAGGGQ